MINKIFICGTSFNGKSTFCENMKTLGYLVNTKKTMTTMAPGLNQLNRLAESITSLTEDNPELKIYDRSFVDQLGWMLTDHRSGYRATAQSMLRMLKDNGDISNKENLLFLHIPLNLTMDLDALFSGDQNHRLVPFNAAVPTSSNYSLRIKVKRFLYAWQNKMCDVYTELNLPVIYLGSNGSPYDWQEEAKDIVEAAFNNKGSNNELIK